MFLIYGHGVYLINTHSIDCRLFKDLIALYWQMNRCLIFPSESQRLTCPCFTALADDKVTIRNGIIVCLESLNNVFETLSLTLSLLLA